MKIDRKELVNPAYYGMLSLLNNTVTMKSLTKACTTFALPHGKSAGATTAISVAIAYGMETEAECRNGNTPKADADADFHAGDPSNGKQSRKIVGDAVFICKSKEEYSNLLLTFAFALNKMGIVSRYDVLEINEIVRRTDGNRILFLTDPKQYSPAPNHKVKYIVFHEAQDMLGLSSILDTSDSLFQDASNYVNTVSFIDYHVPPSSSHWINETIGTRREDCNFHRIGGTYTSMRKEWLGEGFFQHVHTLKVFDKQTFNNRFLAWVTEN